MVRYGQSTEHEARTWRIHFLVPGFSSPHIFAGLECEKARTGGMTNTISTPGLGGLQPFCEQTADDSGDDFFTSFGEGPPKQAEGIFYC